MTSVKLINYSNSTADWNKYGISMTMLSSLKLSSVILIGHRNTNPTFICIYLIFKYLVYRTKCNITANT